MCVSSECQEGCKEECGPTPEPEMVYIPAPKKCRLVIQVGFAFPIRTPKGATYHKESNRADRKTHEKIYKILTRDITKKYGKDANINIIAVWVDEPKPIVSEGKEFGANKPQTSDVGEQAGNQQTQ